MSYIQSYHDQTWLLPPNIEDLLPEDHVCYVVESLVDSMDFQEFDGKYSGPGHPAYHPKIILRVLVMGVLDRMRSSRRLARNVRENVVYMYLAEKLAPDFRTISDFRKNNSALVREVFKHIVKFAKQAGMLDLSHLATDGTKIKASAANKRFLTKEELDFLLKFVDGELEEWAKRDEIEDKLFVDLRGNDQLPGQSKKRVEALVKQYVNELKEKGGEFKTKVIEKLEITNEEMKNHRLKKVSLTDPESRFMRTAKGKIELSYNAQVTVDRQGFIVASDVCQDSNDSQQLKPQVKQTEENLGYLSDDIPWSFDNSYFEGENLAFLNEKKIDGYVAAQKTSGNPYSNDKFIYDQEKDEYICPKGKPALFLSQRFDKARNKSYRFYKGQNCLSCKAQKLCTNNKKGIRYLKRNINSEYITLMTAKMQTEDAQKIYKLRSQTAEPAIGDIKYNKGLQMFLTRGFKNAKTEFNLVCIGHNIKKIWAKIKDSTTTASSGIFFPQPIHLMQKIWTLN